MILPALVVFAADQTIKAMLPAALTTSRVPVVIMLLAAAGVLLFARRVKTTTQRWIIASMLGAGASNVFDMLVFGHIRDVFTVGLAVFNLSDVVILVGIVLCFCV